MRTLLLLLSLAVTAAAQEILVVTPDAFRPALKEWRAHRTAQGLGIVERAPATDMAGLVKSVHAKSGGKLRFVLLLGDVKYVPCAYEPGEIIQDRDPRIANDNHCGDLDGDRLPDLAVGRPPADSVEEAAALLKKVITYENNRDFSSWRRRINIIAGVGGFGWLQDKALEAMATEFLTKSVPDSYDMHVTYASVHSPFCPPPAEAEKTTIERFNEGALVVTYIGHGNRLNLDRLRHGSQRYPIFSEDAAYSLAARHGAPIAALIACSTGHFDGAPDCLGEIMLKQPGGPVAVIASSRVSMPYANGVVAKELLEALVVERSPTVGEALMRAKRRFIATNEGRARMEAMARAYQPDDKKREQERVEHLYLYNLLGDPSMRIPHLAHAELACAEVVHAGTTLAVTGRSPVDGDAIVEFVLNRTPLVPARKGVDFAGGYARANQWVKASVKAKVKNGRFAAELSVPAELPPVQGYHVRVFVSGADGAAMGARPVNFRPAK